MRKLAWFAACFSGAVFLAVYALPEGVLLPAGLCCALLAAAGRLLQGHRRLRWMLVMLGLGCGLLWTAGYAALFHAPARALDGTEGPLSATVTGWPYTTSTGGCAVQVRFRGEAGCPINALLYLDEDALVLRPGDTLQVSARFRLADTLAGEENDYYFSRNILLFAYGEGELSYRRPALPPVTCWPTWVGKALKDSVARLFPPKTAGLITALITGDKSQLEGGLYSDLRRAGLAHVVAVSGLHVSFLCGVLTTLLGRGRRAALAGIGLMFFFAAAAGSTPSALRAAFMQSMLLLGPLLGREDDRPTSLAAALFLLLVYNPYSAASISLQLSFAAVAGIYLCTQPLCQRWQKKLPRHPKGLAARLGCRAWRVVTSTLAVSLGALVFTTPLVAYYFRSVCLIAPVSNLLCLWAVSDAFLGGLASAVVGLVLPWLGQLAALVTCLPANYLMWLAPKLGNLPFASVSAGSVYLCLWLGLVYAMLLLRFLWPRQSCRTLVPVSLAGTCLCAALLFQAAGGTGGRLNAAVLDVGQGLSVALCSGGNTALIDCGGSALDNAGDIAANHFQALGFGRIDLVILTHFHDDHAAGVPRLLERMEVGTLVLPDVEPDNPLRQEIVRLAQERKIPILWLTEDGQAELGQVQLRLYAPLGSGGGNEEGLSVLCSAGEFDLLVTGDMNATVEQRLVKYGALPQVELLVAGHHGSKSSTSEELLLAVEPEWAVISVGYNNYGHPAAETLERLAAAGCDIYRTDWSGTVRFMVN